VSAVAERPAAVDVFTDMPCGCPGCRAGLDPFTADHFAQWASELTLDTGQKWIVEDYFGVFLEDYFAGIPENWLIVPEGNAKTTNLGGLAGYLLEHRPVASIPWAASSRDQAEIGYRQTEGLVLRSSRLRQVLKCQEGYRRIKNLVTGGRMQVFAADDKTGDGVIPTDAFIDELHRHRDLRLYRTWRGKLEKRGGQMAAISTAGEPGSEFEETRELIRQTTPIVVRRPGFVHCRSDQIALHEYAVAEDGDVEDMTVVKQANPFTGITEETLAAKRSSPTMTHSHWRRFVCNLPTRSSRAAITEAEWANARVDDRIPEREPVWAGLDVAWKWDTTALVPLYWRDENFRLLGPATVLEPPRDGTSLDPGLVEKALIDLHDRNPIHTVVMDTTRAEQLATWIEDELGATVIDRGQSNSFAVMDYERFMEALREGWLKHTGDPALNRHVLNAVAKVLPQGDARFDRPAQSRAAANQDRRVIDALVAAAMVHATAVAEFTAEPQPASSWRPL
jgi:phage terminase large subunit-like protein